MPRLTSNFILKDYIAFAVGFVLSWFLPAPAPAAPIPVVPKDVLIHPIWTRAKCGSVCTVKYSPGGIIDEYLEQVANIKRDGITLKIDGPCISACTIAADKARNNVCITPRASFQFHRGFEIRQYIEDGKRFRVESRIDIEEYYSADVVAWVKAHGGFPGKDMSAAEVGKLLTMPFADAKQFFKVCQ